MIHPSEGSLFSKEILSKFIVNFSTYTSGPCTKQSGSATCKKTKQIQSIRKNRNDNIKRPSLCYSVTESPSFELKGNKSLRSEPRVLFNMIYSEHQINLHLIVFTILSHIVFLKYNIFQSSVKIAMTIRL